MRANIQGLLLLAVILPTLFAQQDRIAGSINSHDTVVLKGSANPRARLEFDRGPVDPMLHLDGVTLNFKPTAAQQSALQELLKKQQDRASADYHKWLQPAEYADRFGLSSSDFAKVAAWARAQGLRVEYQANMRTWMRLSGTAAQVQSAFHTELHRYEVDGEMHFANAGDPSIPAALEPLISVIRGLDDFYPKAPHRIVRQLPDFTETNGAHVLVPADLWTIYDMTSLLNATNGGAKQSLVIVGQSNTSLDDVREFRKETGLPANDPQIVAADNTGTISSQSGEIDLDLELAGGMAPNATIYYVFAADSFLATQYAIDNNIAPVISSSYTECESQVSAALAGAGAYFEGLAQQGNALGITWVVSSGDQGAAACDTSATATTAVNGLAVTMPASIPEVTGVGGTTFNDSAGGYWNATNNPTNMGSALKYIPEGAWNDTAIAGHLAASGGGASSLYQKPSWQTGLGVPNDGARDVPDVALAASADHVGYITIEGGLVVVTGGTSAAAPVFAGMLALLNQYLAPDKFETQPGLGNINPTLYRVAHSSTNAFHDITSGSNIVPCAISTLNCANGNLGWSTGPGYDEATGLGSIDLANLASQWGAPAGAALTFTASPAIMNQNLSNPACPFAQYLTLQETNGYGVDLTSASYTSSILGLFGSVRIPPLGSLSTGVCYPSATAPSSATLETDGTDTLGNAVVAKTSVAFQISAQSMGNLAASPMPLTLNAAAPQSASGVIALTVPAQQQWTVAATPSGQDSAWLSISPHAGTGPAQITVTASGAGLSDGVYSAILVFQSQNTSPQYVATGVIFTVGAGPSVKITSVLNAASFQQTAAPGMYLSIFGSGLAPPGTGLASSTSPLPLTLAGVSATINGIPAAMEYVSPGQVNVLMPFEIPAGTAVLGLNNNGQVASYLFTVSLASPGIFVDGSGLLAGAENASRGAEIAFYITGQGDVSPAIASNTAVAPPAAAPKPLLPVSVTIGGVQVAPVYDSLAYYFEGLTQINVIVPNSISTGSQKVVVTVGGIASSAALLNVTN